MENELQNILKKVRNMFLKFGIKSISMDDISRELGISKKTLYQYVSDKAELVRLVVEMELSMREYCYQELQTKELNAIEELLEVSQINNQLLREYNPAAYYDLRKYYPDLYEKMYKIRRKNLELFITNNLQQGINEGIYRNNMNVRIVTMLSVSRIEQLMDSDYFERNEIMQPYFYIEVFEYHFRAISSPKGLLLIEKYLEEIKSKLGN